MPQTTNIHDCQECGIGTYDSEPCDVCTCGMPEVQEEPQGFQITDDNLADWAVKKIIAEQEELARIESIASAQIGEISAKVQAVRERSAKSIAFFKDHLQQYFDTVESSHKVTATQRSYKLLHGTLTRKAGTIKPSVDDVALLEWLKETGRTELIKDVQEPKWGELKKQLELVPGEPAVVESTGEVVAGVTVDQNPDTFEIK